MKPGKVGYFELRYYALKPAYWVSSPRAGVADRGPYEVLADRPWPARSELGTANGFVHLWAYESLDQRMQVRDQARKDGAWPRRARAASCWPDQQDPYAVGLFSPLQ